MRTVVSTDQVPVAERFGFWHDMLAQQTSPMSVRTAHASAFEGELTVWTSGSLSVLLTSNDSVEVARTKAMIRRGDSEEFYFTINYRGEQCIVQDHDSVLLRPGDMVLLHTSRPTYSISDPNVRRQLGALFVIDPTLVPGGVSGLRQLLARPLSNQDGLVALVARHLYSLATGNFHPDDIDHLTSMTTSLISLMLARHIDTEREVPADTQARALYARVRSHIQERLGDPTLNAESIAAAHHVSIRTLYRLFEAEGTSIAAVIRNLRLDRCRADLLAPQLADRPIRSIAQRWGFTDVSHFTRLFRAAYGVTPAATRALAQGGRPTP